MAGAYCQFCGIRCFVERIVPDGPRKGWRGHMATCQPGMAHDRKSLGHDHTTAINPLMPPPPPPGQFCERHWSWLCQNGQGKCQSEATGRQTEQVAQP